jgi:hypothetical protein
MRPLPRPMMALRADEVGHAAAQRPHQSSIIVH